MGGSLAAVLAALAVAACSATPAPTALANPVSPPLTAPPTTPLPSASPTFEAPSAEPSPTNPPSPSETTTASSTELGTTASPASPAPASALLPSGSLDIAALLTASISLVNAGDTDLRLIVNLIDPSTGKAIPLGTYVVKAGDQLSQSVPPASYHLDFRQAAGATAGRTCALTIASGDSFSFVAVPAGIAVFRKGVSPSDGRELAIATSSLCKG